MSFSNFNCRVEYRCILLYQPLTRLQHVLEGPSQQKLPRHIRMTCIVRSGGGGAKALDQSDFVIALVQPDDRTESRGTARPSQRDNVIFELELFMTKLGRHGSFLIEPRGEEIRLPSDIRSIITVPYRQGNPKDLAANFGPACNKIRQLIRVPGPNF